MSDVKSVVSIFFTEILHAGRGTIDMKHTNRILVSRSDSDHLGGLGGWGQNSTFKEYGHVAYQIKTNEANSNMATHILPADTPVGSKQFLVLKVVMLQIKLKGMEYRSQCKQIFCPYTHP